jgi:hypothetical protein
MFFAIKQKNSAPYGTKFDLRGSTHIIVLQPALTTTCRGACKATTCGADNGACRNMLKIGSHVCSQVVWQGGLLRRLAPGGRGSLEECLVPLLVLINALGLLTAGRKSAAPAY